MCVDVKNGVLDSEVKDSVVSFQKILPGMCPYFFVASLPQIINENNDWGSAILNACVASTEHASNEVIMNTSTDGFSCETKWNYTLCVDYLRVKTNQISLPDTNHNIFFLRYQLIGGSSPVSFGFYAFNPWLLKIAVGVPKEVIWVEDYVSDAAVLLLEPLKLVNDLITLN